MRLERARDWLSHVRNPDGSWGYLPGDDGAGEPTLLAVASGEPAPLPWLETAVLHWSVLMVPMCLHGTPGADTLIATATEHMLGLKGEIVQADFAFDPTIPAWPWFQGTSPWVEPTAYAVTSLRVQGMEDTERCRQGVRMLRDRQCSDGGWNYGNPAILGAQLESDLTTTGRVAIALPTSEATDRALGRLRDALSIPSTEHLALATLAHVAHGRDGTEFADALARRQADDGSFTGRVDRTALAALAFAAVEGEPIVFFTQKVPS